MGEVRAYNKTLGINEVVGQTKDGKLYNGKGSGFLGNYDTEGLFSADEIGAYYDGKIYRKGGYVAPGEYVGYYKYGEVYLETSKGHTLVGTYDDLGNIYEPTNGWNSYPQIVGSYSGDPAGAAALLMGLFEQSEYKNIVEIGVEEETGRSTGGGKSFGGPDFRSGKAEIGLGKLSVIVVVVVLLAAMALSVIRELFVQFFGIFGIGRLGAYYLIIILSVLVIVWVAIVKHCQKTGKEIPFANKFKEMKENAKAGFSSGEMLGKVKDLVPKKEPEKASIVNNPPKMREPVKTPEVIIPQEKKPLEKVSEEKVSPVKKLSMVRIECPKCGVKMPFPSGKGKIIVTCAACKNKFEADTEVIKN